MSLSEVLGRPMSKGQVFQSAACFLNEQASKIKEILYLNSYVPLVFGLGETTCCRKMKTDADKKHILKDFFLFLRKKNVSMQYTVRMVFALMYVFFSH